MIWYLLYPLRGTIEAPVLDHASKLRAAIARYGRYVACHPVNTLLISVAVASILVCPFPFLYSAASTVGAPKLPHHAWTTVRPLNPSPSAEFNATLRSIWIRDDYMNALDRDALLHALELETRILSSISQSDSRDDEASPLLGGQPYSSTVASPLLLNADPSVQYRSPLLYWNYSGPAIESDSDLLGTLNGKHHLATHTNFTLENSLLMANTRYHGPRLTSADALIITLLYRHRSPIGQDWQSYANTISTTAGSDWDDTSVQSTSDATRMYLFQARPVSALDTAALIVSYGLVAIYVAISLTKLTAVKSRFGLVLTAISQVALAIISGFTLCAVLGIDLSRIPPVAYPIAILSISLENIFRLINAVVLIPAEKSPIRRISHAFGETAHVAFVSTLQNAAIAWGLSMLTSPEVSAFCKFASIALLFDFFYLSTFFLSVLSVDVLRMELSDALAESSMRYYQARLQTKAKTPWPDRILAGRIALSTRIVGTVVMVGFVVIAQLHFPTKCLGPFLHQIFPSIACGAGGSHSTSPPPAISPDAIQWLELLDHGTIGSIIHFTNPGAYRCLVEVPDPLVFIRRGAKRTYDEQGARIVSTIASGLVQHHFFLYTVAVLSAIAAVYVLTKFLLPEDSSDSKSDRSEAGALLSVKSYPSGHSLDIAKISTAPDGCIVSIGLDRVIRVWNLQSHMSSYSIFDVARPKEDPFPIWAVAINHEAGQLALLSPHRVALWDLVKLTWGPSMKVDLEGQKPEAFFFLRQKGPANLQLVFLRRNGTMVQLWPGEGRSVETVLCKSPFVSAEPLFKKGPTPESQTTFSVVTASRRGCVHHAVTTTDGWQSDSLEQTRLEDREAHQVVALSKLDAFLVVRSQLVDLVDAGTNQILHTFVTEPIRHRSLRCHHSSRRKPRCGSIGLAVLALAFVNDESGDLVVHTYLPSDSGDLICFRNSTAPASSTCCPWSQAKLTKTHIPSPGVWEALPNGSLVGVRRKADDGVVATSSQTALRRRRGPHVKKAARPRDDWEVWLISQFGKQGVYETRPLHIEDHDGSHLMINDLGPMVKIGTASMAIGFGNAIKLVMVGHEHFDDGDDALESLAMPLPSSTRRPRRATLPSNKKVDLPLEEM